MAERRQLRKGRTIVTIKHFTRAVSAAAAVCAFGSALHAQAGSTLVDVVKEVTSPYQNVQAAINAGYASAESCVSGPQEGAMGVHFIAGSRLFDGEIDAEEPEALIYEPANGQMRLLGVEYIVIAADWHAHNDGPPVLLGQHFHYVGSPNRYGLPAFYELHVWAWRQNTNGTFADWNTKVSCDGFAAGDAAHAGH
jgi:hypothetical protein